MKCPLCDYAPHNTSVIPAHITRVHKIVLESEELTFQTEENFYAWKLQEELRTCAHFLKVRGDKCQSNGSRVSYFKCHRSGKIEPNTTKRNTTLKINALCPANIKLSLKPNGEYVVNYLKTHVGHENVIKRLPTNPKMKKKKLKEFPTDDMVVEILNSEQVVKVERQYPISPESLEKIAEFYNSRKESTAIKPFQEWLNAEEESVLYYQPADSDSTTFVLILMNQAQAEILKAYGNNCVYLQRSKKPNQLGYELFTLVALDDFNVAYPCAFLITNEGANNEVFDLFLREINHEIGSPKPQTFISDTDESTYKSWVEIMGEVDKRLYCSWDVIEDWTTEMTKTIENKTKIVEIFADLKALFWELDTNRFNDLLSKLLNDLLNDPVTHKFGTYFYAKYATNCERWARCLLVDTPLEHVDPQIDKVNETILYFYFHLQNFNNISRFLQEFMSFLRDKLINRLLARNDKRMKTILGELNARHRSALTFANPLISQSDSNNWIVSTQCQIKVNEKIREVCTQCDCNLICAKCETCIHRYICSCIDSKLKWNMCKHIHLLSLFRRNGQVFADSGEESCDVDHNYTTKQLEDAMPNVAENLDDRKNQLESQFKMIMMGVSSEDDLEVVKTHLNSLSSVLTM